MLRLTLACSIFGLIAGANGQDLRITSAKPVGPDGIAAPVLGDASYGVRVNYVIPPSTKSFRVKFTIADQVSYMSVTSGAGTWSACWLFYMPLDGTIPYSVTLDPDNTINDPNRANNVVTGTFTPTPPKTAVEYYGTQSLTATETISFKFSQIGGLTSLKTLFGVPVTATSQSVSNLVPPSGATAVSTSPFGQPASLTTFTKVLQTLTQTLAFSFKAANVRVNTDLVKDTWSAFSSLPSVVAVYTTPEAKVQSTDPKIVAYAKANLPSSYRSTLSPIQAARKLFCAVIRDTTYLTPSPLSALEVLTTGKGDCGGFSQLYIACLRSIGIPARQVCGWLKGTDVWHCWSEIYMPSVGWIPQDATNGDGCSPSGSYAYCFGVMPDLNARASVSRATTNNVGSTLAPFSLQAPNYWYTYAGPVAPKFTSEFHSTLK